MGQAALDGNAAVEIRDLRFSWDQGEVLFEIAAFTIGRGEKVFLQGPSGCGKSTLLGLIGGVLEPRAGSLNVLGSDLVQMGRRERDRFRAAHVGLIFQMFNLIPYLTVLENVLLPLRFSPERSARLHAAGREPRTEARRLLAALGLHDEAKLQRSPTALSQGQQQRVAAARALLGSPELLIADEPTSSLDADTRESFLALLMQECAAAGTSVLFVSHDASLSGLFDRSVAFTALNRVAA